MWLVSALLGQAWVSPTLIMAMAHVVGNNCGCVYHWHAFIAHLFLASYPAFMGRGKNAWFQPFVHVWNFLRNLGNRVILVFFRVWNTHNHVILVFFRVMATCSDRDDEFSSALVLRIIYIDEGYSDWEPWINDSVVIVLLFTPWCCAMMY